MKNLMKLMLVAFLAFGMFACGEKKLTEEDLKKAEATLFNEDQTLNEATAPSVAEKYVRFVEQNPDDPAAQNWMYNALEIYVMLKDSDNSIKVCDRLVELYPDSKWAPRALYLLGAFVYEDQLNDLDKARELYERVINEYPDCDMISSVQASLKYLGWSNEDIINDIAVSQMEVEEGEW
jgi:outer membrane protein assembly factor BamD (BamD/ComL family)